MTHLFVQTIFNEMNEVFCEKDVLRNFAKFIRKHLCQSLFFNKAAGLRSLTFLKKETLAQIFPVNFAKFLRTAFIIEQLLWLLQKYLTLNCFPDLK